MKVERKMGSSCGVSIHKKTVNGRLVVESANSNFRKYEAIYRRGLRNEARDAIRKAKSQDSGCLSKRSNFAPLIKKQGFKCASMSPLSSANFMHCIRYRFYGNLSCEEIGAAIIVVIMALMVPLGLYLVRRYNRTLAYGAGGCVSTAFYTYDYCEILS